MSMQQYPILYKKTNTGAIQFWEVKFGKNKEDHGAVKTIFGQLGTDKPQTTLDILKEGKNIGKKNETTPIEQAIVQAKQMWDKKVKSGYVENLEDAKKGKNELQGIKPMLAHKYEDRLKDIDKSKYILIQPKLDGMRCIAVIDEDYKVNLYTRTQKPINTVPHIVQQLETLAKVFDLKNSMFDGELYNHECKDDFNKLMSIIKRDEVHEEVELIQYHIYDFPSFSNESTMTRIGRLQHIDSTRNKTALKNIKFVETKTVTKDQIDDMLGHYMQLGYEGAIVRLDGQYENKRSKSLLKYKKFQDAEFKIVGVEEGKGKLMGHAGSFVCELPDGRTFNAKMNGKLERLKEMFENFDSYKDKLLTVEFFDYTPDKVPRFPVGKSIRDYE